jgi:signal transduction histidine kinase
MLILAFCWLIMAQISQYEAPIWAFSWWMYHLFMLGAYLITMIYLVFNYEEERSFKITRYFISLSLLMGLLTTFLLTEVAVNLSNQEALRWTFIGVFSLAVLFLVIVFYALVYRAQQILNARQFVIEQEKQWRTDMSNLLAHDLMSPLNAIILDLDLLKKRHQSESDADLDIVMRVNRIRTSSETMVALLFDMLNVERLESGVLQLDKQNLNVPDLINETVQNMRSIAEYRRIDLTVHIPPDGVYMDADKMIIGRVVQNLLSNALKFAPQGGKVSIRLTKSQDQIYIEVGDNGPGIPKDQLERIFEKFGQINHEDKQRGFGLGLAFCKLAVEAHEGKIQVENNQGTGTLFRCIFQSNP